AARSTVTFIVSIRLPAWGSSKGVTKLTRARVFRKGAGGRARTYPMHLEAVPRGGPPPPDCRGRPRLAYVAQGPSLFRLRGARRHRRGGPTPAIGVSAARSLQQARSLCPRDSLSFVRRVAPWYDRDRRNVDRSPGATATSTSSRDTSPPAVDAPHWPCAATTEGPRG